MSSVRTGFALVELLVITMILVLLALALEWSIRPAEASPHGAQLDRFLDVAPCAGELDASNS